MAAVVIGALRVDLGLSTASFRKDADAAAREAGILAGKFKTVGLGIAGAGAAITAGITMPFVGLMKAAIPAAIESQQAIGQVNAALASMGPVAGKTSAQLADLAAKIQATSTIDDDDILRDLTANMLTFGKVAGPVFDRAQQAAVDMSVRMKTDLKSSAILVGKALNDPIKGMAALAKVGVKLSDTQKAQVQNFVKVGDIASAQGVILGELEGQFGGSAKAMRDATPGADTTDAWRNFQETLGAIALKILPPLTSAATSALNAFNSLSPGAQTFAVAAVAVVAAIGPLAIGLGAIVSGFGLLIPLLPAIGGGLALLMGPLAPLTAAVLAGYLAWQHWDEIKAIVASVGAAVSSWWKSNVQPTFAAVGSAVSGVVGFFKGLFAGGITGAIGTVVGAFVNLHVRALGAVASLVGGVTGWIQGKLGSVFEWLRGKLGFMGDLFFQLYDRVVGHSYIPDMVDGVAAEIGRLQGVMVDPTKRATQSTAGHFRDLAKETAGIFDRLFPEIDKVRTFDRETKLIEDSLLSAADKAEAQRRLLHEFMGSPDGMASPDFGGVGPIATVDMDKIQGELEKIGSTALPGFRKRTAEETAKIAESFAGMARNVLGSMRGMVDAFKGGDIVGGIMGIADLITNVISGIAAIKGLKTATPQASTGYQTPSYGGTRALGGAMVPGKTYRVGERGPEYVSVPARANITPDNDNGRRGGMTVNFNGVMTSDEFWSKIDELDAQAAHKGALGGAQFVQQRSAKKARQRLGRG